MAFFYNMVRIIVGSLIRVGEGKIKPNEIKNIIESKQRSKAGNLFHLVGYVWKKCFIKIKIIKM